MPSILKNRHDYEDYDFASVLRKKQDGADTPMDDSENGDSNEIDESIIAAQKLLDEYEQEGKKRLEECQKQIEVLLEEAKKQAETIKAEAFKSGEEEGYQVGQQKAYDEYQVIYQEKLEEFKNDAEKIISEINITKDRTIEKYIDDLKQLTITISEKIICTSLKSSEKVIKKMIMSAADSLKKRQWAKIYISKCHTEFATNTDVEFLNAVSKLSDNVKIVVMDSDEPGTCILELPDVIIDASASAQLENIKDIIGNAKG